MKVSSPNGLLLYNTGLTSKSDYVGVEMVDSHLRLIVDRGNGAAELISEESISDGQWHSIVVFFTPTILEIIIDKKVSSIQLTPTGNRYLDLDVGDILFVGKRFFFVIFQNLPKKFPMTVSKDIKTNIFRGNGTKQKS